MTGAYLETLLHAPVTLHGIQLGRPVDAILDRDLRRVVGLEIHCGDDGRRFLPFAVAQLVGDEIVIASSLVLLDPPELVFYSDRGSTFASIRGSKVLQRRREVGTLVDLRLGADGAIDEVVVEGPSGRISVDFTDDVSLEPPRAHVRVAS